MGLVLAQAVGQLDSDNEEEQVVGPGKQCIARYVV
jgi:hypothetical protein